MYVIRSLSKKSHNVYQSCPKIAKAVFTTIMKNLLIKYPKNIAIWSKIVYAGFKKLPVW